MSSAPGLTTCAAGRRCRARGQSLVELALFLPVMLALVGASIDLARLYGAWVTLEGGTRNAAVAAAQQTSSSRAATVALAAVCAETRSVPGYVGSGGSCTMPSVTVSWSSAAAPGTNQGVINHAEVVSALTFRTLVPWPLIGSPLSLESRSSYRVQIR